MPRPTQAQGRPGTCVIPANWGAAHGDVVRRALTAAVTIGPSYADLQWNDETGQMDAYAADALYTGPASLMPVSDTARILTVVEDPTSTRVYDITLDRALEGADLVEAEHVITVTGCDDALLAGKSLVVTAIERGSQRFSRVLLALLND